MFTNSRPIRYERARKELHFTCHTFYVNFKSICVNLWLKPLGRNLKETQPPHASINALLSTPSSQLYATISGNEGKRGAQHPSPSPPFANFWINVASAQPPALTLIRISALRRHYPPPEQINVNFQNFVSKAPLILSLHWLDKPDLTPACKMYTPLLPFQVYTLFPSS